MMAMLIMEMAAHQFAPQKLDTPVSLVPNTDKHPGKPVAKHNVMKLAGKDIHLVHMIVMMETLIMEMDAPQLVKLKLDTLALGYQPQLPRLVRKLVEMGMLLGLKDAMMQIQIMAMAVVLHVQLKQAGPVSPKQNLL